MPRVAVAMSIVAVLLAWTPRSYADERLECAKAYEQTQRLRQKGELLASIEEAERCARSTCPAILQADCAKWGPETRAKLPTMALRVRGRDGCAEQDATITISGPHQTRGLESVLDPGSHEIRVVDPRSGMTKTETIDFAEGERRELDFDFAVKDAICGQSLETPAKRSTIPTASLVVGGVGAGLLATGALVGLVGASKRGDLDECKPNCSQGRIDFVQRYFTAGDVLALVGVLAIGAGVGIYFLNPPPPSTTTARRPFVVTF